MIDRAGIEDAYGHIAPFLRRTPVIEVDGRDFGLAGPLHLKLELLQHASSFKPRGAFMNLLTRDVPPAGVVAASGGNHGAAVAYAAMRLGISAKIFVPTVSPQAKVQRIKDYGAEVVIAGDRYADALAASEDWIAASGALSVHAYDQVETLLGQGTTALEFENQVSGLDTVLVAVGGGGFIGGIAAWFGGRVKVVGVEPRTSCALHSALAAGGPVDVEVEGIAADSLGARSVGGLMYPIAAAHVAEVVLVEDEDIRAAQAALWNQLRLVAEPGGAAAFAAVLSGAYRPRPDERLGVLVCGGNTDALPLG
ncbi:MAG TPA: threonine/serine dehydratase [Kiloniellaceae bacterium]|nr:threonine/serine dehydratase [Kiloniellaceae bacterium]